MNQEWQKKQAMLVLKMTRLYLRTGGKGSEWERLELLLARLDPKPVDFTVLGRRALL